MFDKDFFISIGERLRHERKRLSFTQEIIGEITNSSKPTVISWEKGNSSPNAGILAVLAQHKFDVLYIVTGKRTPIQMSSLSIEETSLVDYYRNAAAEGRKALEATGAAVAKPKRPGKVA